MVSVDVKPHVSFLPSPPPPSPHNASESDSVFSPSGNFFFFFLASLLQSLGNEKAYVKVPSARHLMVHVLIVFPPTVQTVHLASTAVKSGYLSIMRCSESVYADLGFQQQVSKYRNRFSA